MQHCMCDPGHRMKSIDLVEWHCYFIWRKNLIKLEMAAETNLVLNRRTQHANLIQNHYILTASLRSLSYHFYVFYLRKSWACSEWPSLHWKLDGWRSVIKSFRSFFYWSFHFTIICNAIRCCESLRPPHKNTYYGTCSTTATLAAQMVH